MKIDQKTTMTKRKGRKGEEWRNFRRHEPEESIVLTPERDTINSSRTDAQKDAINAWARKGFKGSIIAATGFGKSRIGVLAVGYSIDEFLEKNTEDLDCKCLVLVPTTQLQAQFEEEFKKWGFESYLDRIDILCYQSAHKLEGKHYHVVLCDEIHLGLSPVYREFFEYNTYDRLLCMTATMPEEPEYRQILINLAPPVYKLSLDDAVEKGYVADYQIYCIGVKLTTPEKEEYDAYQNLFVRMKMALGYDAFTKAQAILSGRMDGNKGVAAQFMNSIRGRKKVVQHAGYKIDEAKVIIDHYKDDKVLTFGGSNAFADEIAECVDGISYHSGKTPKKREDILECFRDGGCRVLCTTKALNQGFNVPDVGIGIIVGLESKSLPLIQRVGRLLRKSEDKVGRVYILYVKDSQEETWLNKAVSKLKNVQRGEDLTLFLK